MMRRAPNLYPHFIVPSGILSPCSSAAAAVAAPSSGRRSFIGTVLNSPSATSEAKQFWLAPLFPFVSASIASKSVSVGLAGALSFSMALSSAVEAKEQLSLEFLPKDVVLYQYEACPFCNKVKDIIDKLDRRIHPEKTILDEEESKWRRWVDEHLVHVLSPNIYRTISEALESFDYITTHGNFSFHERLTAKYAGAAVMYMVSKKLKKKYNITDERAALYEAAETWSKAINGREFLGGSRPNLADLTVFGVLRPIRYLRAGRDMVENTSIGEWFQRMEDAVGESSRLSDLSNSN